MKEDHIDIDRMVMSARYLHALGIEDSRSEDSLSDMERKDYIDMISSLRESNDQLKEMISDLRDTVRSLKEAMALCEKQNADLLIQVGDLKVSLAYANEKLAIRNKDKFDTTSLSNRNRKNKRVKKKSREEEKEEHDGSADHGSGASTTAGGNDAPSSSDAQSLDMSKVSSEHLDGKRGPRMNTVPGTHCTPEFLSDIILDNIKFSQPTHRGNDKMVYDGFQVSENTRKNWMHKAYEMMSPLVKALKTDLFKLKRVLNIDETWCRVRIKYKGDKTKLGTVEKKYIWVIVNRKTKAEEQLSRSRVHYSETLRKAMVYMLNGWENLVRYREDGEYAIDNNIAERSIRPLTNNRKNSLFYGSERGVKMSVWFHSLVETGKARNLNLKNWFVSLIRELMRGNNDYEGLLQGAYI